tara:strand:+ start:273 stop:917 length:645 start_codon:yes stop_codon:yes gene_type:complete
MKEKTNIVIPVREPTEAKNRLSPLLTHSQRATLSLALFRQSVEFYRLEWPNVQLTVITDSITLKGEAVKAGAVVLDDPGLGLNSAVDFATEYSLKNGFSRQMIVHSDIPVLEKEEVARLLDSKLTPPSVVIVPATNDGGTNVLLECPPGIISHHYGIQSRERHEKEALTAGAELTVLVLKGLGLDLDTEQDIHDYLRTFPRSLIAKHLVEWGIN